MFLWHHVCITKLPVSFVLLHWIVPYFSTLIAKKLVYHENVVVFRKLEHFVAEGHSGVTVVLNKSSADIGGVSVHICSALRGECGVCLGVVTLLDFRTLRFH